MVRSIQALYSKLIIRISTINKSNPNDWTISDSLAYICFKYKERFDQDFVFTYDNVPSKCIEYKMASRCWLMLGASGNGELVKEYIDWFYDNYKGKKRFTSLGAMAKPSLISSFKEYKSKPVMIKATKELSDNVRSILSEKEETSYIRTYGDLYFFVKGLSFDEDLKNKFIEIEKKLQETGFNLDSLKEVV